MKAMSKETIEQLLNLFGEADSKEEALPIMLFSDVDKWEEVGNDLRYLRDEIKNVLAFIDKREGEILEISEILSNFTSIILEIRDIYYSIGHEQPYFKNTSSYGFYDEEMLKMLKKELEHRR